MSICGLFAVAELVEASKRPERTQILFLAAADRPSGLANRVLRRVDGVAIWPEHEDIHAGIVRSSD